MPGSSSLPASVRHSRNEAFTGVHIRAGAWQGVGTATTSKVLCQQRCCQNGQQHCTSSSKCTVSQSVSHNCSCCQLPTRSVTGCMKPQFSSAAHHVQTNACNRCQRLPEHNTVALPNCMVAALPGAQRCRSNKFEAFGTIEMFCRSDWLSWR
jgi:hypothetical protein